MSQRSLDESGAYRKARETRGRYLGMQSFLGDVAQQRVAQLDEIIGVLTSTTERLRAEPRPHQTRCLRDEVAGYGQ